MRRSFGWIPFVALLGCAVSPSPNDKSDPSPQAAREPTASLAPLARSPLASIDEHELDATVTRDPFVATAPPPPAPPPIDTRPRKSKHFDVADLKLVATVTETDTPRAMLVDPRGKGWVVTRGEIVGRAETVDRGERSWRVGSIHEGDIVLVREDPFHDRAPVTRVLAMRTETEDLRTEDD